MRYVEHQHDLVVVGGGISGLAAAVTAARRGLRTALVQDRPVLGGTSSKEIQILLSGARHCNFAYSRETGLMEELLLENLHSNPTCSVEGWDLVLQQCVRGEPSLDLFLNTAVSEVHLAGGGRLAAVRSYNRLAETWHSFRAPLFADCTGDGTVAVLAGNPFRQGCEARSEFGESLAPASPQHHTMGHSIQFRARDAGRPIPFRRPPWVPHDFTDDDFGPHRPIIQGFRQQKGGFWWLEWGGDLDAVHDHDQITQTVLGIVYGVWDYLKNRSPLRAELATWELEWVGSVLGKRESRRLEGDYLLTQNDVETQRQFDDAVAFGGWGFDDHPPQGFFDQERPSFHVHHAGPYNVPLRCLYARAVDNLFFAGRNISATHVALSSTRVMLTCGQLGEAVGAAAAACRRHRLHPRQLVQTGKVVEVQRALLRADHHIVGLPYDDPEDLAREATVAASSELSCVSLERADGALPMDQDRLWQFPVVTPRLERVDVRVDAAAPAVLEYALYAGPENGSTYPDARLCAGSVDIAAGPDQWVSLPVELPIARAGWQFLEVKANPHLRVHFGRHTPVGLKGYTVRRPDPIRPNPYSRWQPWGAMDQPAYCLRLRPSQPVFAAANATNPWARPTDRPQLWSSAPTDFAQPEWLELRWDRPRELREVHLLFDSALDLHLTNLWTSYDRTALPSLVRDYRLLASDTTTGSWLELAHVAGNYLRRRVHAIGPVKTDALRLEVLATNGVPRAQVYSIRVY